MVALLLVAGGELGSSSRRHGSSWPAGSRSTVGTALGGWPIVRTLGRRITLIRPIDALASQAGSTAVLLGASVIGAPVSTTQIVASSVVGVGGGRRRWRHVRWRVVRAMLLAWLVTVPATAAVAVARPVAMEVAHVSTKRWFLPESPDLLGMLRQQAAITVGGDGRARRVVGRRCRRAPSWCATASTAPTQPSANCGGRSATPSPAARRRGSLHAVGRPGRGAQRGEGSHPRDGGHGHGARPADPRDGGHSWPKPSATSPTRSDVSGSDGDATELADAAIKSQRRVEHAYRARDVGAAQVADLREVMGRREVYRRLSRIGDLVHIVAERVWYAVVKEA